MILTSWVVAFHPTIIGRRHEPGRVVIEETLCYIGRDWIVGDTTRRPSRIRRVIKVFRPAQDRIIGVKQVLFLAIRKADEGSSYEVTRRGQDGTHQIPPWKQWVDQIRARRNCPDPRVAQGGGERVINENR